MAGGTVFSKIDLLQAYLQLEVRPQDRELITLNTHRGLYRPTRLMYGVASAPAIWQRTIENILKDIPGVAVFLDDIRVSGTNMQDHLVKLQQVFERLHKYNIRINFSKSQFLMNEIHYCGYVIDKNGLRKEADKVEAISKMRRPSDITELRSFLGMIHYYDRFIPNLSSVLQPLNNLLKKGTKFHWSEACERSFQAAKKAFQSPKCLVHFDPRLPITLATDASPYGVGAVLSHVYPDGSERVIQYASQTLTRTQQSYSQIDKEAYAIIYGIKKFHQYLHGAKFTLITDHRPLTQIFSLTKSLPYHTAARMQHYALFLQGFNYDIRYRKSEQHANADCLSRLPIPRNPDQLECETIDVFQNSTVETLPVTAEQVAKFTVKDKQLSKLLNFLKTGQGYFKNHRFFTVPLVEFTLLNGVIFRNHRVVIPFQLRKQILRELHESHFGIVRMKHLARGYVWWNQIDKDIEEISKNCANCNRFKNDPPKISHLWEQAEVPFERIHADFAGPFLGHNFLILVDAYTKWPLIHIVKDIKSDTTIYICRQVFATYGLPRVFVTDNGRSFVSEEFEKFLKANGITHRLTAPYHPATNGQAERYVQTLKNSLKQMQSTHATVQADLQKLLTQYRNTPHAGTGKTPAEMLFARKLRTRLDLSKPFVSKHHAQHAPISFTEGERVSARNYNSSDKWLFGRICERLGTLHYKIKLDDGRIWKRHVNQLRKIGENTPSSSEDYLELDYATPEIVRGNNNGCEEHVSSSDNSTRDSLSTSDSSTIRNSTNIASPGNETDITVRNASGSSVTTPTAPSFSPLSQSLDSSIYSTPKGSFQASTPKPSPPLKSPLKPIPENLTPKRPSRTIQQPLRLRDCLRARRLSEQSAISGALRLAQRGGTACAQSHVTVPLREDATGFSPTRERTFWTTVQSRRSTPCSFEEGRRVSCRNYAGNDKWLFGTVTRRLGTLHYEVQLDDGRTWKRHVNQMRLIGTHTPIKREEQEFDVSGPLSVSANCSKTLVSSDAGLPSVTENVSSNVTDSTITASEGPVTPITITASLRQDSSSSPSTSPSGTLVTSTPLQSPEDSETSIFVTPQTSRPVRTRKLPLHLKDYVVFKDLD
ncbi:PREDICTED: uncharacterized protein K02A2.6-like [Vollenhovia emeryi]|uniref:uncharacterized protein K02A2.6-like n=1 Tax=Vollenhovia emeryi TaxID=411798 RepID=UPI0005F46637|nr:PREDICTED: uncharacterized protein K02A2.6-like [Vollenhovia emeryi]